MERRRGQKKVWLNADTDEMQECATGATTCVTSDNIWGGEKTQVISRVFTHSHAKLRALTISKMTRRGSNYVFFLSFKE